MKYGWTTTDFIANGGKGVPVGTIVETTGFTSDGDDGGAPWQKTANTGTPSQTPAQLGLASLTDALGFRWDLLDQENKMLSLGAVGDGIEDDSVFYYALADKVGGNGYITFDENKLFRIYHKLGATGGGSEYVIQKPGVLYLSGDPDQDLRQQQPSPIRVYKKVANDEGGGGIMSMTFNGTPLSNTFKNLSPFAVPDNVSILGFAMRGSDGTNPIVSSNFHGWFENNDAIVWVQEIDVQNEGATQTANDDTGGVGVVVNTGSTYSPSTGISIRRQTGAGTAPGFLRGIQIRGARDTGVEFEAMSAATYPDMTPAPTGTLSIIRSLVSGDTNARVVVSESGKISIGSGSAATDVYTERSAANQITSGATSGFLESRLKGTTAAAVGVVAQRSDVGKNSSGVDVRYSFTRSTINSTTAGAESATYRVFNRRGGVDTEIAQFNDGFSTIGTNPGAGNIAATKYYSGTTAGVSGAFTTTDGKTITILNGIVTSIV
jgi:hypothetical protein